jgi:hypothetical protein
VEVVTVLDPFEKRVFDGLVTQLRADDPNFLARLDKLEHPRRRWRVVLAVLLWTAAPICVILGGWTGLFMAMVAVGYGMMLASKRPGLAGGHGFSWWSTSPGRHPGAPL